MNEVRPQNLSFLNSKVVKLERHRKMLFKWLTPERLSNILTVFDYGCSDGYLLKELDKFARFNKLQGCEINPGHASWGRYIDGLDITREMDLDKIPGTFDLVILYHVFEHLQQPDKFLDQLRCKINTDGYLYIGLPVIDRLDYPNINTLFKDEHINMFTKAGLIHMLELYGFQVVEQNDYLYGLCLLCKKLHEKPEFTVVSKYTENLQLLQSIKTAYDMKEQFEKMAPTARGEAIKLGFECLKIAPPFPEMIIKVASMMDTADEQDFLEEWIAKYPNMFELQIQAGLAYFKDGKYDDAIKWLRKAEDITGKQPIIQAHIAYSYYHKGEVLQAIEELKWINDKLPFDNGNFEILASIVSKL